MEIFYDKVWNQTEEYSGLIGAIWKVRDNLSFDAAFRYAIRDGRPINEIRAGLTFAFKVDGEKKDKEGTSTRSGASLETGTWQHVDAIIAHALRRGVVLRNRPANSMNRLLLRPISLAVLAVANCCPKLAPEANAAQSEVVVYTSVDAYLRVPSPNNSRGKPALS